MGYAMGLQNPGLADLHFPIGRADNIAGPWAVLAWLSFGEGREARATPGRKSPGGQAGR